MDGDLSVKCKMDPEELRDTHETKLLRERMVRFQLAGRRNFDPRVLFAMGKVPRHWFCSPGTSDDAAYGDHPLPIGFGQTISQPLMVAEMLQQLQLSENETVLEVGTGSGYNAALLSHLAFRVVTLEIVPELAAMSREVLRCGGFNNVEVILADGSIGWPSEAPYEAIVVTAGAPVIPAALKEQLRYGGRLVIPVGDLALQQLFVVRRTAEGYQVGEHGGCRFVPLQGKYGWK